MSEQQTQDSTASDGPTEQRGNATLTQAQIESIAEVVARSRTAQASERPDWADQIVSAATTLTAHAELLQQQERQVAAEDNSNGENGTSNTPDAPVEQTQERTFTQAELGAQLSAARNAERSKHQAQIDELKAQIAQIAERTEKPAPKQPIKTKTTNSDDPPAYVAELMSQLSEMKEQLGNLKQESHTSKFDAAFKASGLPEHLRELAEPAVKAVNPEDIAEFLSKFKTAEPAPPAPKPAAAQTEAQATKPAPSLVSTPVVQDELMPGGTPAAVKDFDGVVDPSTLTSEDIAHLRAADQFRPLLERWNSRNKDGRASLFPKKKVG